MSQYNPEVGKGRTRAAQVSANTALNGALREYRKLTSDDARAAFADKWTRIASKKMDESWSLLYECLQLIRDRELYKNPMVMEGGQTWQSFAEYWEDIARQPFATWAELESTYQTLHQIDPDLLQRLTFAEARAMAVAKRATEQPPLDANGTNQHREKTGFDNVKPSPSESGGNHADYLTARIARDHPAILERMKAGEFRSVRAAAREAGIVRPTAMIYTDRPEDAARAILRHFQGERLEALICALSEGLKDNG